MKDTTKNDIVNGLKTAAVVASASFTLNSCVRNSSHGLDVQDMATVSYRTDSILDKNHDYRLALSMADYSDQLSNVYRSRSKKITRESALKYIKSNISDAGFRKYMLDVLLQNNSLENNDIYDSDLDCVLGDTVGYCDSEMMSCIRRDYRWFNDLMLYLSDKYTPEQLLKTGFFKNVNDLAAEKKFKSVVQDVEKYEKLKQAASQRGTDIYNRTKQECISEYKKEKQR